MARENRLFELRGHWLARRKDSDNIYIFWWPKGKGTRRSCRKSTGETNLDQAKERLIEHLASSHQEPVPVLPANVRAARPSAVQAANRPALLLDVIAEYLERIRDKPSFDSRKPTLKWWTEFSEIEDVVYVGDLTLDMQEKYLQWRRRMLLQRGFTASNGTLIKELGVLVAALNHARDRGKIENVPRILRLQQPPPRDRYLSQQETFRLLKTPTVRHLRVFNFASLHTLSRPIALFCLKVDRVDLVRRNINLLPAGTLQSKKRRPIVPISATLLPIIRDAVENSESGFVLEWKGKPITTVRTAFAHHCENAEVKNCTPYVLRHTGATWLAAKGVPMRQISGLMGISEQMAERVYAKHSPEFMAGAARVLDDVFGDPAKVFEQANGLLDTDTSPQDSSEQNG